MSVRMETSPGAADKVYAKMKHITLQVISSDISKKIFTVAAIEDRQLVLYIICQEKDNCMRAIDMYGQESFNADSLKSIEPKTNITLQGIEVGTILNVATSDGIATILPSTGINMCIMDPTLSTTSRGQRQTYHNIYTGAGEHEVAKIVCEGLASTLTVHMNYAAFRANDKKAILVYALQLFYSEYKIQKFVAPHVAIAVPKLVCGSHFRKELPSYCPLRYAPTEPIRFTRCFMLRMAGGSSTTETDTPAVGFSSLDDTIAGLFGERKSFTLDSLYYDAVDLESRKTLFTIQCPLDSKTQKPTCYRILDKELNLAFLVECLQVDDVMSLNILKPDNTLVGKYIDRTNSFQDNNENLIYTVHTKKQAQSYPVRWGSNIQHYIDPDIALVSNFHCGVGVTIHNEDVPERAKALATAFAMKANFTDYKFDTSTAPIIEYKAKESEICQNCKLE